MTQFRNRPDTTIVPVTLDGMKRHLSFSAWPQGTAAIDLGGRTVTVLPTPGTHKDGPSFYDSATGHLFTGDLLFPGRILISNDTDYIAGLTRLESFAAAQPIRWLLGATSK